MGLFIGAFCTLNVNGGKTDVGEKLVYQAGHEELNGFDICAHRRFFWRSLPLL